MFFDALHEYCTEGTGGADIFACTAAQATFSIYHGDARGILSFALLYHFDCAVGTVTLAVVAADAILVGDAVIGYPHGCTYFCRAFLFWHYRFNGSGGAHIGTRCACWAAETALERHFGLHQAVDASRRAQHIVGAFRHAQLACCAVCGETA